jgi:hypothetical protein
MFVKLASLQLFECEEQSRVEEFYEVETTQAVVPDIIMKSVSVTLFQYYLIKKD